MWIKLEPGCQMPEIDEFVLWRTEEGNYFVAEIDKDDPDWWNGTPLDGGQQWRPKCTHWKKITGPDEEPDQEAPWYEAIDAFYALDAGHSEEVQHLKSLYTITRK